MSRFRRLEFGDESEKPSLRTEAVKDEFYYLGEAASAFEAGKFEQALRYFAKVLEQNPKNPVPWTGQVRMLIELGEFREAKVWADKALEQFPREPELLAAKAVALARLGDRNAALAFADAAAEERGESAYVWLARGDVLLARREKAADYCIRKALSLASDNWLFPWLASRIYCYYRKYTQALKLVEAALQVRVEGVLWLQLGYCQRAVGLLGRAVISFEQASHFDDCYPAASLALTSVQNASGAGRFGAWVRSIFGR